MTDREYFQFLYKTADTDHDGILAGNEARNFLQKSGLPFSTLKQVKSVTSVTKI
jgi:hypothetical protein